MKKKQKQELIRNILYALSGVIVGGAVGGALLMKMVTEGDTRRAQAEAAAEQSVAETTTETSDAAATTTETPVTEMTTTTTTVPPPGADELRAMLAPAESLFTVTYCYTDADCYESYSEMWGKKMPFTTDSVVLTCDGTISMAVDAAAIGYEVDAAAMRITVTLPAPDVISHELDEDSIRYYDVKSSLFRTPTLSDYSALLREMKESIRERVVTERGFDRMTLEQAENVIRSCFAVSERTVDYAVTVILPQTDAAESEESDAVEELPPDDFEIPVPADDRHAPSFWW